MKSRYILSLILCIIAVQVTAQSNTGAASGGGGGAAGGGGDTKPTGVTTTTSTTSTTSATTPTTSNTTPTTTPTSTPTSATTPTQQSSADAPAAPSQPAQKITVVITSGTVLVTQTEDSTPTSASSSAAPSNTAPASDSDSGLGTGSIVGLSVAGGVAVIGIIAFFVWKFTRKRFSDFDDNEAIKWPDLNNHGGGISDSHPLPVKNTGRAGFDTASDTDLSRIDSANYSTQDFHAGGADPYAVPPLPHLNPNQPYQDDPTSGTGYYDPYRGPVPGSIEHGPAQGAEWGHHQEAIPMTQLSMNGGRMSPSPYAPGPPLDSGRQSPGPYAAYGGGGRAASPGPQAAYGGRMSPGPQMAYNHGATSPAPRIQ